MPKWHRLLKPWPEGMAMNPSQPNSRPRFAYRCLDGSEPRDHFAGQLANELYPHFAAKAPPAWTQRLQGWLRSAAQWVPA